ncbi:MAG TPA: TlpA disulfide reductase family protein [Kofleriaceae bacterium]|nr:TlpA disulfide reductase family protein [Kofleriaceae bacterium]
MKGRALAVVVAAVAVGLVAFVILQMSRITPEGVEVGENEAQACVDSAGQECLPKVVFIDTAGKTWTPERLRGKVVMINFWATWCHPCIGEVPALEAAYSRHKDDGFVLLGLVMDNPSEAELAGFAHQTGLAYPVVQATAKLQQAFGSPTALPTTFVYDRTGHLRLRHRGPLSDASLEKILGELLAAPAS